MPKPKSIAALLKQEPIDWEKIKTRVTHRFESSKKNLLHKVCTIQDVPKDFIEWVVQNFPNQLSFKSGIGSDSSFLQTPLEICLNDTENVSVSTFDVIVRATNKLLPFFPYCGSLDVDDLCHEKLAIIFSVCHLEQFNEIFVDYLIDPFFETYYDIVYEDQFIVMLDAARRYENYEGTLFRKPDAVCSGSPAFLVPHTYLWLLFSSDYLMDERARPDEIQSLLEEFIEAGYDEHFGLADANGWTLLHYVVINANLGIAVKRDVDEDDDFEDWPLEERLADWKNLLDFLVDVEPDLCVKSDCNGQTPLHIALDKGLPHCMSLVQKDACALQCRQTRLYPFQLAASSSEDDDDGSDCDCEYCSSRRNRSRGIFVSEGPFPGSTILMHLDDSEFMGEKQQKPDVVLTMTYEMLRMAPHVLLIGSTESTSGKSLLDNTVFTEICIREMQAEQLNRQHYLKMKSLQGETDKMRAKLMIQLQKEMEASADKHGIENEK